MATSSSSAPVTAACSACPRSTVRSAGAPSSRSPRLSLRGTAIPVIAGDVVACGFDNGRVLGLNRRDGSTLWEVTVSPPTGRTELQRLNDIDSAIRVAGDDLYAVSFQGRVARIGRETGQVSWTREVSSYRGLTVDEDAVYVSTSDGEVVKIGAPHRRRDVAPEGAEPSPAVRSGRARQPGRGRRLRGLPALHGHREGRAFGAHRQRR